MTKGQEDLIAAAKVSIGAHVPAPDDAVLYRAVDHPAEETQQVLLGQATPEQAMQTANKAAERLH